MTSKELVRADKEAGQNYWAAIDAYKKTPEGERGPAWKRIRKARKAWNRATQRLKEASC